MSPSDAELFAPKEKARPAGARVITVGRRKTWKQQTRPSGEAIQLASKMSVTVTKSSIKFIIKTDREKKGRAFDGEAIQGRRLKF
jgi:hypothetical protein